MMTKDEIAAVQLRDQLRRRLAGSANVHGVALGGRWRAHDPTGEPCLTVFVRRKVPLSALPRGDEVPSGIGDLRTDVVELPPPRRLQAIGQVVPGAQRVSTRLGWRLVADDARYPFLCGGIQIMSRIRGPGQGTLGCLLRAVGDENAVYALTNYHVIEGGTEQRPHAPTAATRVGHPTAGVSICGCCSHQFGTYAGGLSPSAEPGASRFDAAVVRLDPGTQWAPLIIEIGAVRGWRTVGWSDVVGGDYQVLKRGVTTGLTGGVILAVGYLSQDTNTATSPQIFANDMVIRPNPDPPNPEREMYFALDGDSGAVVVNAAQEVVGLLWGAAADRADTRLSDGVAPELGAAFATPIDQVLATLRNQADLDLEVAWTANDVAVETVPGAAAPPAPSLSAGAVPTGNPEQTFRKLGRDLAATERGAKLVDLWLRHQDELLGLINKKKQVAARWHRGGGAALFRTAARCVGDPRIRLPLEIEGRPTSVVVAEFASVVGRYGSEDLSKAVRETAGTLPPIGGLTYTQALNALREAS